MSENDPTTGNDPSEEPSSAPQDDPPTEPAHDTDAPASGADDDSDEVRDLKTALAAQRKEAAVAKKEIAELKRATMTESEQQLAQARDEGRAAALAEVGATIAEARFRSAAAGKVADVDQVLALAGNMSRFVTDDGAVDDDAIASAVDGFAKLAPPAPAAGQSVRKGVGENGAVAPSDFIRAALNR